MSHTVVVLGAGYAGLPAAKRLARQVRRDEVNVVLVSEWDRFVERPRLHQLATGQQLRDLPLEKGGVDERIGVGVELIMFSEREFEFSRADRDVRERRRRVHQRKALGADRHRSGA